MPYHIVWQVWKRPQKEVLQQLITHPRVQGVEVLPSGVTNVTMQVGMGEAPEIITPNSRYLALIEGRVRVRVDDSDLFATVMSGTSAPVEGPAGPAAFSRLGDLDLEES